MPRVTGSTVGRKPPDTERQRRLGTPGKRGIEPAGPTTEVVLAYTAGRPVPAVPDDLDVLGVEVWTACWTQATWLSSPIDGTAIRLLCETVDEREVYRQALRDMGPLLAEPIVTPRGDVVGTKHSINPAEAALRRCNREISAALKAIGGTPESRARLALVVSEAMDRGQRVLLGMRKAQT